MGLKKRVLVLASGRGSNFCAIADAISLGIISNASIVGVISNKTEATVLEHAKDRNISGFVIESNQYRKHGKLDRNAYEEKLLNLMLSLKPDLICLAGYMLVLGKKIVEAFPKKIINIHPSLLPKFRGLHAQKQALESGDKITGCTVHWVTEGLDEGLAILQAEVPILSGDNEESLSLRMLPIEHQTYISALKLILK